MERRESLARRPVSCVRGRLEGHQPTARPTAAAEPSIVQVGLRSLCPRCGAKTLYVGMIKFAPRCTACGLDFDAFNVGDGPAAFLTLIIGTLVCIAAITLELSAHPPMWLHILLWPPITLALVIGLAARRQGHAARAPNIATTRTRAGSASSTSPGRDARRFPLLPTISRGGGGGRDGLAGRLAAPPHGVEGRACSRNIAPPRASRPSPFRAT